MDKWASFLTSSSALAVICFLGDGHSDWGDIGFESSFSLHFPSVGHGFPGIYWLLAFYGSLYILDINPLPDVPLCIMAASLLWWPFPVLYRSSLISWHPIYQFLAFFPMLLQFCSESPCLANIWKCFTYVFQYINFKISGLTYRALGSILIWSKMRNAKITEAQTAEEATSLSTVSSRSTVLSSLAV